MTENADPAEPLLDAAREIFLADGVKGLSVRKVADLAGCTTMTVYTRYGGKDGLLGALFDEGFQRLHHAQKMVNVKLPPHERVLALCNAYRATATAYPHHYALMLGELSGEHTPSPESSAKALATLQSLERVVEEYLRTQLARDEDAKTLTQQIFAFCHGWVSLQRFGFFSEETTSDAAFEHAIMALLGGVQGSVNV